MFLWKLNPDGQFTYLDQMYDNIVLFQMIDQYILFRQGERNQVNK